MTDPVDTTTLAPDEHERGNVHIDEHGTVVYRASAVGDCFRALAAARIGYVPLPFPERLRTIFAEGHHHEALVLELLRRGGWIIHAEQEALVLPVLPGVVVRGHVDAMATLAIADDEHYVAEVKALGADTFKLWLRDGFAAFPKYAYQFSSYMIASGRKGLFCVKNRNSGQVHVTIFDDPPVPLADVVAKVARVEAAGRKGELGPCDADKKWGCPFLYLHDDADKGSGLDAAEIDETGAVLPDTAAQLKVLAESYDAARERVVQAEAMKAEARDRLAKVMADAGLDKTNIDGWSIMRKTITSRRVNIDALRAMMDVTPFEMVTESEQIRVTPPKK